MVPTPNDPYDRLAEHFEDIIDKVHMNWTVTLVLVPRPYVYLAFESICHEILREERLDIESTFYSMILTKNNAQVIVAADTDMRLTRGRGYNYAFIATESEHKMRDTLLPVLLAMHSPIVYF